MRRGYVLLEKYLWVGQHITYENTDFHFKIF